MKDTLKQMRRSEKEITDVRLIEEIINKADVCRLGLANGDVPYIITMNFGYSPYPDKRLFFHCANEGRKLQMIGMNNYVCFEMDTDHQIIRGTRGCDWSMKYNSVIGYGTISVITGREEKISGLDVIMAHYGGKGPWDYEERELSRSTILQLDIKEMTGKKC